MSIGDLLSMLPLWMGQFFYAISHQQPLAPEPGSHWISIGHFYLRQAQVNHDVFFADYQPSLVKRLWDERKAHVKTKEPVVDQNMFYCHILTVFAPLGCPEHAILVLKFGSKM